MATTYQNFIGGKWQDSVSGKTFENRNPANWDEVVGIFPLSNQQDVDQAVAAALEAQKTWRLVPAPRRGDIMKKAGDLMVERKEEISRLMTREMGKVLIETRGDTQEGIDTAYYAFGESRRLFGHTVPSELPDKFNMTMRIPIGVAGLISPWNFPMAIPTWKIFPALLCGNSVVFKPASDTPATAAVLVEILEEAGVPPGVLNIVHGGGSTVGNALVEHENVGLISFTGSTAVGKIISEKASKTLKRVSLELGGKNAQVVLNDANLDLAVEGALWGAFGTTGQRCTATSRLVVQEGVYDKFIKMLLPAVEKLKLGDGLDERVQVGPVVNESQLKTMDEYVAIGKGEGARLLTGGEVHKEGDCARGFFFKPTVFGDVDQNMRLALEEIFGPILSVIKVKDLDEAIEVVNNSSYGLSSSVYTNDISNAYRSMRDIEAGITYINVPTIGAECHMPFGGVKGTGNGHREGGWEVYDFFSETKTIYVDFSGKLQRAQIDTE